MTVLQLINELRQYPPDTQVKGIGCGGYDCEEVEDEAYIDEVKNGDGPNVYLVIRC